MASENFIMALIFSIIIMVILSSSGFPVTPPDTKVIVCRPWLLCGTVAYDPQEHQCCKDGSVQSLSLNCGPDFIYDPCSKRCCPDSVQKIYNVVNKTSGGNERSDCEKKTSSN